MSDKEKSLSLDEILEGIRREREMKAGILNRQSQVSAAPERESVQSDEYPVPPEPANTTDSLISAYLTDEEISAARLSARSKRHMTDVQPEQKTPEPVPEPEMERVGFTVSVIGEDDEESISDAVTDSLATTNADTTPTAETDDAERKRKDEMELLRVFSEQLEDESLLQRERREEKRGKQHKELVEQIDGKVKNLFDAVDKVEKKKKKPKSAKFFIADSPAELAELHAKSEMKAQTELNVKTTRSQLMHIHSVSSLTSTLSAIITGMLILLAVLPEFYKPGNILEALLGGSGRIYLGVNLVLMFADLIVACNVLRSSISSLLKLTPSVDICVLIVMFFSTLQNLVLLISGGFIGSGAVLYNSVASFTLLLNCLSKYYEAQRMLGNLKALSCEAELNSIQTVNNSGDAKRLAHGLSINGKPRLLYDSAESLPSGFYQLSTGNKDEQRFLSYALPLTVLYSLVIGIISVFTTKSILSIVSSFTGCICICMPVCMTLVSNMLISKTNSSLNKKSCAVLGYNGIEEITGANAVVMNAGELCYAKITSFACVKAYYRIKEETALAYVTAVMTKSECVLAGRFRDVAIKQKISIPSVEELKYEDRLGFTAWIENSRVLVGNREMMMQHNVKMPSMPLLDNEKPDEVVMYVAIEGKLVASFTAVYYISKYSARQIRSLSESGIILMLLTNDVGITENFIARQAGVSPNSVKIGNTQCRDIMQVYHNSMPTGKSGSLFFSKSNGSALRVICSVLHLNDASHQAFLIQFAGFLFAASVCLAVNLLGAASVLTSPIIIIYQVIWCLIAFFTANAKIRAV